jgi:flagellar basal-body rod modification protein FlgD
MAVDAIGVIGAQGSDVPRNAGISQDDFLRILLSQLRFQDPLKPVDNQQFVAQLAQFSALEINRQQSEKIDTLLAMQSADQALALLGKSVELRTAQASTVGTVSAVSLRTGEPRLTVVGNSGATFLDVRLSDVILIR